MADAEPSTSERTEHAQARHSSPAPAPTPVSTQLQRLQRALASALALLEQDEESLRNQTTRVPKPACISNQSDQDRAVNADAAAKDISTGSRAAGSPRRRPRSPQLVGREVPGELGILAHTNGVQTQGSLDVMVMSGSGDLETIETRRKPRGLGSEEGAFGHGKLDPS